MDHIYIWFAVEVIRFATYISIIGRPTVSIGYE